jgi:tetratricopeptide (TPR) repeat protein
MGIGLFSVLTSHLTTPQQPMIKANQQGRSTLLIGALLFLLAFSVYRLTLCPTVSWYDSGELVAACYHLGIAHPTGYPLYTMLGRIFTLVPIGNIAQRVNMMSAFFGALTVVFLYLILKGTTPLLWRDGHRLTNNDGWFARGSKELPAVAASLAFAFSPLFWTQTAIAEVYTFHTFLIALLVFTLTLSTRIQMTAAAPEKMKRSAQARQNTTLCLFGFLLGLSCAHHLTTLLFVPAFLFFTIAADRSILNSYKLVVALFLFFVLGLSVDLYLMVRADLDPTQNWGNPDTWKRFMHVITGLEIRSRPTRYAPHSIGELFSLLGQQFLLPGIILGIVGIYSTIRRHLRLFLFFALFFAGMIAYIFRNYDFLSDQYLPVFFVFALWIGLGIKELTSFFSARAATGQTKARAVLFLAMYVVLLAYPFSLLALNYPSADMSRQRIADHYGEHVLRDLEPGALILSEGSNIPLLLSYHQRVEGKRSDVASIYLFLMDFAWYRRQLSQRFPEISVPLLPQDAASRFLEQNLRSHPVYYTPFSKEPNVDIGRLIPHGFIFRVEQERTIPSQHDIRNHFRIQDSFYTSLPSPLDQASKDILTQVHGTMGLYFECTGLYDEAVREYTKALEIDSLNPGVHYDFGSFAMERGMFQEAIRYFRHVLALEPSNLQTRYMLAQCYIRVGEFHQAIEELERLVHSEPDEPRFRLDLGVLYGQIGETGLAVEQFEKGLRSHPRQVDLLYNIGIAEAKQGNLDRSIQNLERAETEAPERIDIVYALASSYAAKKDVARAERYFQKTLQLGGPDASTLEDLGHLYRESGQWQKAIEAWEYALQLEASNTQLQQELLLLKERMQTRDRSEQE